MVEVSGEVRELLNLDRRLGILESSVSPERAHPAHAGALPLEADMDDRLLDAKIEATEARTDAKFAELKGLLAAVPSRWDLWGGLLALFVAILSVLAFGSDRLSLGLGMADQRQDQLERDRQQDATVNAMNAKLDQIINNQKR